MTGSLDLTVRPTHTFSTQDLTQEKIPGGTPNPLLSLPAEMLSRITEYVNTGSTQQEAAAHAITWGKVAALPHLMTHEPRVERAINHAKDSAKALVALWEHCIVPNARTRVPQLTATREIRDWITDPNHVATLSRIRSITLVNRGLKAIPIDVTRLPMLLELIFEQNQIAQVYPEALANCGALWNLRLSNNQIIQVDPQAFKGCPSLQVLYLSDNLITQIHPQTFAGCGALTHLALQGNQITQIHTQTFARCGALTHLALENNQISQIHPEAFAGCGALTHLSLQGNRITQVDPEAFADCLSLQELSLHHNLITEIHPQTFANCLSLQKLYLNNNRITQIHPQTFANCGALIHLSLKGNRISQVDPEAFAGCGALTHLTLEENRISQIDPEAFADCLSLQMLYLNKNALLCTFSIKGINYLPVFTRFSGYVCRSQWAAFYKAVSENKISILDVAEHLKGLEERNLIYEMVYWKAKAAAEEKSRAFDTGGDPQWGENHVCDDKAIFCRALKSAVREKFDRLSTAQKGVVHDAIYRIAQEEAFLPLDAPEWNDPNWGEKHRKVNVLWLIDAMGAI